MWHGGGIPEFGMKTYKMNFKNFKVLNAINVFHSEAYCH